MRKSSRMTTPRLLLRALFGEPHYSDIRRNGASELTVMRRYRARRRRMLKITKRSRKINRGK